MLSKPKAAVTCLPIYTSLDLDPHQHRFLNTLWTKFSSLHTLVRVIAWIRRFKNNSTQGSTIRKSDILTSTELADSKRLLIRLAQAQSFPEVISAIKDGKSLSKSHTLYKTLYYMEDDQLVVPSRVRDTKDTSMPCRLIPLHAKSLFTVLLIRTLHITYGHAGVSTLHSILAQSYLIPNLRNLLKLVSRKCAHCQKADARPLHHQIRLLPTSRTTPTPPFYRTGVDFAGPFMLKQGYTRKPVYIKCYAAVFICLVTKAVHLDLCGISKINLAK